MSDESTRARAFTRAHAHARPLREERVYHCICLNRVDPVCVDRLAFFDFWDLGIFEILGIFGFFDFWICTYIGFGGVGRISLRCHSKRGPYMLKPN